LRYWGRSNHDFELVSKEFTTFTIHVEKDELGDGEEEGGKNLAGQNSNLFRKREAHGGRTEKVQSWSGMALSQLGANPEGSV
jgi:hypothetical protein